MRIADGFVHLNDSITCSPLFQALKKKDKPKKSQEHREVDGKFLHCALVKWNEMYTECRNYYNNMGFQDIYDQGIRVDKNKQMFCTKALSLVLIKTLESRHSDMIEMFQKLLSEFPALEELALREVGKNIADG